MAVKASLERIQPTLQPSAAASGVTRYYQMQTQPLFRGAVTATQARQLPEVVGSTASDRRGPE